MKLPTIALASLALFSIPTIVHAEHRPISDITELKAMHDRWANVMDTFDVPGMAVAVVKDGQIYVDTFGVRDPAGGPVTADTMFYIASITKTYVATAICQLADQGKLSLDDPVKKHLPQLKLSDSALTETLTIRDLLCHRYGINSDPIVALDAFTGEITEDRYWYWLAQCSIKGSVDYTNVHFTILGRVIESVTGVPWRDHLDQALFTPAGMNRTTGYASELYGDADCAVPMERAEGGWIPDSQRKTDRTMHAAGGLGTSALDGARWLKLHLNNGASEGRQVVSTDRVKQMRVLDAALPEPDGSIRIMQGFGHAWQVGTFNGHAFAAHGGGYEGASAYMAILPDDGVGVVVLINAGGLAQGLGDIVAIDVLEKLTATTSAFSVYDRYLERVPEFRKMQAAEGPKSHATLPADSLSRPIGLYTGWYHNEHLGTLIIELADNRLRFRLGDDPAIDVTATDAPNHFSLDGITEAALPGEFILTAEGNVSGVRLAAPGVGTFAFER